MDDCTIDRSNGQYNTYYDYEVVMTMHNIVLQVTKSEVDSYLPGMRIPHCELAAHSVGELVTRLVLQISLLGAKPPRNKFTLSYMPPTGIIIA